MVTWRWLKSFAHKAESPRYSLSKLSKFHANAFKKANICEQTQAVLRLIHIL